MANALRDQLKVGATRFAILLREYSSSETISGLLSEYFLHSCRDGEAVMCLGQVASFDGGSSSAVPRSVFRVPPTHPTYMHR